jgi:hypothetical protein
MLFAAIRFSGKMNKLCKGCGQPICIRGNTKYCDECAHERRRVKIRAYSARYRKRREGKVWTIAVPKGLLEN